MRQLLVSVSLLVCCCVLLSSPAFAQDDDPLAAANALIQEEKWGEAATLLEAVVAEDPTNGAAWLRLGRCFQHLDRADEAISAYLKSAEHGQPAPPSYYYAARVAGAAGQGERAVELLEKVVEAGGAPYQSAKNAAEFDSIRETSRFQAVLEKMRPCNTPEHRQFDFWIGDWEVLVNGQLTGYNTISAEHERCVLVEDYSTPGGFTGASLNFYDANTGKWHQTWIANNGSPLYLDGGLVDGKMVMSSAPGESMSRIIWTPNEDGTVRQLWESTTDGGKTWSPAFDGLYVPRSDGE